MPRSVQMAYFKPDESMFANGLICRADGRGFGYSPSLTRHMSSSHCSCRIRRRNCCNQTRSGASAVNPTDRSHPPNSSACSKMAGRVQSLNAITLDWSTRKRLVGSVRNERARRRRTASPRATHSDWSASAGSRRGL